MNEAMLISFRKKLNRIRADMVGGIYIKNKSKKDNLNNKLADIADDAVQSHNRQLMIDLSQQDWEKLRLVEEAINKVSCGQYGFCSECKEPIPEERLAVIPFAAYCIKCLEAIEKT